MFFCFSYVFFDHELTGFSQHSPTSAPLCGLSLAASDVQRLLLLEVLLQSGSWRSEQVRLATSFSQALYTIVISLKVICEMKMKLNAKVSACLH